MKRKNLFRALAGGLAVFLALVQSLALSATPPPAIDVSNELRSVNSLIANLNQFDVLVSGLKARGHITAADKANLANQANNLKRSITDGTSNTRAVINKLRAAGVLALMDGSVRAKARGSKLLPFIEQEGGVAKVLETAVSTLNDLPNEVDQAVREISALSAAELQEDRQDESGGRFKGHRLIRAGFAAKPAPFGLKKIFKCIVAATAFVIAAAKDNPQDLQKAEDTFDQAC